MSKSKNTETAEPKGLQTVDNTEAKEAPAKEVKTEEYELVEGLKQVNYL